MDDDPEPECSSIRFVAFALVLGFIVLTFQSAVSRADGTETTVRSGEITLHRGPEKPGSRAKLQIQGGRSEVESQVLLGSDPIIVHFKNDDRLGAIEVPPVPLQLQQQAFEATSGLTDAEREQVLEMADHMLLGAAQSAQSAPAKIEQFGQTPSSASVALSDPIVGEPDKVKSTPRERMRIFLTFVRNSTVVSFIRASKAFVGDFKQFKSNLNEFGFEIGFRIDLQLGVGRYAVTKNYPVLMRFGYNWNRRELIVESAVRKERMADGFSIQGGARAEFRIYQRYLNPTGSVPRKTEQEGQGWYPPGTPALPMLPALSFVWDKTPDYHAQGISIGFNAADYVFQSYIMNTVNDFVESTRTFTRLSFARRSDRSGVAGRAVSAIAPNPIPTCSLAFAGAL